MNPEQSERFWSKVDKTDECWTWTASVDWSGYGLFGKVDGQVRRTHRLAFAEENGPIPDGMCVLHRCDTPACVRPSHLFLGTRADNMRDRQAKGRQARGERHSRALLTERQVTVARKMREQGCTVRDLAVLAGVAPETMSALLVRRSWSHVA